MTGFARRVTRSRATSGPGTGRSDLQAIRVQPKKGLAKEGIPSNTSTGATCIHQGGTQFQCEVTDSSGPNGAVTATVASDGQSWVSHASDS